jgi:hypothetical protein
MAKSPKTNKDGYKAVIEALRSKGHAFPKSALAKMLGFSRQSVDNWDGVVPESQALRVSILTGVPIESIRPETVAQATAKLKEIS